MSKETLSILKLIGTTAAILLLVQLSVGNSLNDLRVNNSYVVLSGVAKFFLFVIFSAFTGSLVASIISKFRNKLYVKILVFSILLLISSGIYIFSLFAKVR